MTEELTQPEVPEVEPEANEADVETEDIANLKELLSGLPGGPSQDHINQLKAVHGEVFCSGFSDEELYIWRPLRRNEFKELQQGLSAGQFDQFGYEEMIVQKCVLWPALGATPSVSLNTKAGTVTTLADQIMQNSNFLPPQLVARLVQKL